MYICIYIYIYMCICKYGLRGRERGALPPADRSAADPGPDVRGDYTLLYVTLLYYTVLYYIILNTILYSTLLYSTLICFTIGDGSRRAAAGRSRKPPRGRGARELHGALRNSDNNINDDNNNNRATTTNHNNDKHNSNNDNSKFAHNHNINNDSSKSRQVLSGMVPHPSRRYGELEGLDWQEAAGR